MWRFQEAISLDGYVAGPDQSVENPLGVGGRPRPWREDPPWKGWCGDEPLYHTPVFVLTHHPRAPLEMEGGTTFFFVTDGIQSALEQARLAAGDLDVQIGGGADTIQQYLAAGLVDEFQLHVAPVVLGRGEQLLENVGNLKLEQLRAIEAPGVTHIKKPRRSVGDDEPVTESLRSRRMPSVAAVLRAMLSRMDATLMWSLVLIGGGAVVAGLVGIGLPGGERLAAFLMLVVGAGVGVAALAIGTHNTSSQADAEQAFLVASALGFISVVGSAAIVWRRVGAQTLPPPPA